ncbi:MAG: hypothetical protein QGH90_04430 [Candidatus Poseidoniaceae archaeon]|nr:hypothetical protein [Candidatus Poseidoniaceae archaeon]
MDWHSSKLRWMDAAIMLFADLWCLDLDLITPCDSNTVFQCP